MSAGEKDGNSQTPGFTDRRKKDDWVTKTATILSVVSWVVAFIVWVLVDKAQPEKEHLFTRMLGFSVRDYWDESLLQISFMLLIASLCICVSAFIFNMLRKRRKTDSYKKSIIVIGAVTIIGVILFIIRFGDVLMLSS